MASKSSPATSSAIVVYNPNLPHISVRGHLEEMTDRVFRRSFEMAKTESKTLFPYGKMGQERKEQMVSEVARGVSTLYIDKELGERMAQVITRNFQKGNYDEILNPFVFQRALVHDLRTVYHDKHMSVDYSLNPIPACDPNRSLTEIPPERYTTEQKEYVASFEMSMPDFSEKVDAYIIPDTNIGYFKLDQFPSLDLPDTKRLIDEAMQKIIDAEALIIDLRDNNGGDPRTVAFVASYLFDEKCLVNEIYERSTNERKFFYAEPEQLQRVFGGTKPIYVLTGERTFSAAEELAYDLQTMGRAAEVIGQSTAGGAHPIQGYVVDDHFYLVVPSKKAINPQTGTNWEGTGVQPDIPISKDQDAKEIALQLLK